MKQKNIKIKFDNNKITKINENNNEVLDEYVDVTAGAMKAGADQLGRTAGGLLKLIGKTFWSTTFKFLINFGKGWYKSGSWKEGFKGAFDQVNKDLESANNEADRIYQSTSSKGTLEIFLSFTSPAALVLQKVSETEKEKFGWLIGWGELKDAKDAGDKLVKEREKADLMLASFLYTIMWICKIGNEKFDNINSLNQKLSSLPDINNPADIPSKKVFESKVCKKLIVYLIQNENTEFKLSVDQVNMLKKIKNNGKNVDKNISFLQKKNSKEIQNSVFLEDISARLRFKKVYSALRDYLQTSENKNESYKLTFNLKNILLEKKADKDPFSKNFKGNNVKTTALYLMYLEHSINLYMLHLYLTSIVENQIAFAHCISSLIGSGIGLNNITSKLDIEKRLNNNVKSKEEEFYQITNEINETKAIFKDLFPDAKIDIVKDDLINEQVEVRKNINDNVITELSNLEKKFGETDYAKQIKQSNLSDNEKVLLSKMQLKKEFLEIYESDMALEEIGNNLTSQLENLNSKFDKLVSLYKDSADEVIRRKVQEKVNQTLLKGKKIKKVSQARLEEQLKIITNRLKEYNRIYGLIEKGRSFDDAKYENLKKEMSSKSESSEDQEITTDNKTATNKSEQK